MSKFGIYVHIPFCERKCNYCAFSSFVISEKERDKYIEFLTQEIKDFHNKYKSKDYREVDTIYFGGGTPSILSTNQFLKVVDAIKENFEIDKNYEFTVECNPNSLTEEKLKVYKNAGVNRLSIGVQSLDDEKLKFIGRIHDSKMAIEKINLAKRYFDNISCDILIGLKGMEEKKFINNLSSLVDLGVKHISAYMLQIEEGTPLQKMVEENKNLLPTDEKCIEVYEKTAKFLAKKGFERYEVSNFALNGYESRHNMKYWSGKQYIGFGLSAHSYLDKERSANASNFNDYYTEKKAFKEKLTDKELIEEHIMLGLRCKLGVNLNYLNSLKYDIKKNINFKYFVEKGIIFQNGNDSEKIYLNPDYYGINNYVITSLLPD